MAELVAQSEEAGRRWRRTLPRHQEILLGRGRCQWPVPWDQQISRQHISLFWDGIQLTVKRLESSRNPVFHKGKQVDSFTIKPVDHFVIGTTSFTLVQSTVGATVEMPNPAKEKLFSRKSLNEIRFRDAERRLAILSDLPELISNANDDNELFVRLCNVIFGGVSMAASVGIISYTPPQEINSTVSLSSSEPISVLHWDRRFNEVANFQPSSRLIHSSISSSQSVLHVWDDPESVSALTMIDPAHDWAFCTPIPSSEKPDLAIYVSGASAGTAEEVSGSTIANSLQEDIKYTELVAKIAGSLRKVRNLQTRQASLRSFFSPVVMEQMQTQDPSEVLRPRECEVSVLFCDLRGFSAISEQMSGKLMQLLHQVSDALGVTTSHILEQGGVVGDFHGDATMGFWGWPVEQKDQVHRACMAALAIHKDFLQLAALHRKEQQDNGKTSAASLQVGLGIASGAAVAGQIGTSDQVKVTAFGPVVNLAARLETMNRQLNTSILIDQSTLDRLNEEKPFITEERETLQFRTRFLGKVLPVGLTQPIEVAEVLPPVDQSNLSDQDIDAFSFAMKHFTEGNWEEAYQALHEVPSHDRTKDLLTFLITQQNRQAPSNWDGVIRLNQK